MKNVTIVTFGDLIRVPGSESSLEKEKARGADIRIVFSGLEALNIAMAEPERVVVFPGIGFETTSPGTAVTVRKAKEKGISNFLLLSAHKLMPPVMGAIVKEGIRVDGFICPGHVAAITGSGIFDFLAAEHSLGCVVSGFEPTDILQSVLMLVRQVNSKKPEVEIQYSRVVTSGGNISAKRVVDEVFEPCDSAWRGFGVIPSGGLRLRKEFEYFDAEKRIPMLMDEFPENPDCICGDILRGISKPENCRLYGRVCTPENPVGACMVSPEGTCNTHYKYTLQ